MIQVPDEPEVDVPEIVSVGRPIQTVVIPHVGKWQLGQNGVEKIELGMQEFESGTVIVRILVYDADGKVQVSIPPEQAMISYMLTMHVFAS